MSAASLKRPNILVIDPDEEFCKNVRLYLEENYNVNARQGLEYLDYTILFNSIDLILIEADYADSNLVQLLERLKTNHPDLKIIIMYTYFPADKIVEKALAKDADDMIAKPFDVYQLKSKVDTLLKAS